MNREEVISNAELERLGRPRRTEYRLAPIQIQELHQIVASGNGLRDQDPSVRYRDRNGEDPLDRLLRIIHIYLRDQESAWTQNETLSSFFQQLHYAIRDPGQANTISRILWGSYVPCLGNQSNLNQELQRLDDRLRLAIRAVKIDDPQLAVSLIRNEVLHSSEIDNYNNRTMPLDPYYGDWHMRQPQDPVLVLDSAYTRNRMAFHLLDVPACIDNIRAEVLAGPDGFTRDIPPGVLRGQSNFEARFEETSACRNQIFLLLQDMQHNNMSFVEQLMHLQDAERSWVSFAANPETFRSIRTPSPIEQNAPATHRRVVPEDVLELIQEQIGVIQAIIAADQA